MPNSTKPPADLPASGEPQLELFPGGTELAKKTQRKLDRLLAARGAREQAEQEMGIALRPLVMCGLPFRRCPSLLHIRRCGELTLEVVGDPRYGVPFGLDRIIPIFLATAFVHLGCPENNLVSFQYGRDILRTFNLPVDGRYYRRLREGLLRFTHTRMTVKKIIRNEKGRALGQGISNLPLLDDALLWFDDVPNSEGRDGEPNLLRLDHRWADEIRKHPIPVDLQAVRALLDTPGALDFYQWQAWRCFNVKEETRVPLAGDAGLVAQLGCLQGQPLFELRRSLRKWLALIKTQWPDCPNHLSADGNAFVLYPIKALGPLHANNFLLRGLPKTPK